MAKKEKKKKSLLRRILKWTGITFLVLLIALILIPIFFKDQIKELALKEANKTLLADVALEDFDLTFISTFPEMTARFDGVKITGRDQFKGVELANIKRLDAHVDFWSVVGGDKIEIKGISIEEPKFDVRVTKEGLANYDITKPDSVIAKEPEEPSNFQLSLQNYSITNGQIRYDDRSGDMLAVIKNLNHSGKGDLTADVIDFETETEMDELTFEMGGMSYLNKVKTNLVMNLLMEFTEKTSKFTLKENTLDLNALKLSFDGFYEMLEKKDNMDLKLNASKATFKDFLSLIPTFYQSGYESMITNGNLALNAQVKGIMDEKNMPGWDVGMAVDNASIRYPALPQSIKNIAIKAGSKFEGGENLDKMTVDVPKFHADFAGNQLDANLKMRNPMTDPLIDSKIWAKVNLATLGQVIPLTEGESYNGKLDADVKLNGRMSAIEQERYEDFNANGTLQLADMLYKSKDLPADVNVKTMVFRFSPRNLALESMDAKMGKSDFNMNGTIDNYLGYVFRDELLKGVFAFNSNNLDLDELMGATPNSAAAAPATPEAAPQPATTTTEPALIPGNVDFNLNTNIANLKYNGFDIKDIKGNVNLKEEVASLNNVTMNAMGGAIGLTGSYDTRDHVKPKINFGYDLKNIDISQLAKNFVTVAKLAPIAKAAQGRINSKFTMNSYLQPSMEPIYSSLSGGGDLSTQSLVISGFEPLKKLANELKMEKLANQTVKDIKTKFKFDNGKVTVNPFTVKLGKIDTEIDGSTSFEQDIDYNLKMNVPKEEIPASMIKVVEDAISKVNSLSPKLQMKELPAVIPVKVKMLGKVTDPKITNDFRESLLKLSGNMKDQIKDGLKDLGNKAKDSAKVIIGNKVEAVKEDLNKKKQEILEDAQKQADKLKAEAKKGAEAIRAEGDKQADALMDQAGSNPLKKKAAEVSGKKLKKEAEEKAVKVEAEAAKKADDLMNKAREKADQVK